MKQFAVLDCNERVEGIHFLEASAGTGKTFAIEHLVCRLIAEESALPLKSILVITFTRAATRELKMRIRRNLEKALEGSFPYLEGLGGEGIDRIEEALCCFDRAQIFTIHSFCERILHEFAFEANESFREEDEGKSVREVALQFLRTDHALSAVQLEVVLKKMQNKMGLLVDRLLRLVETEGEIAEPLFFEEAYQIFCEKLELLGSFVKEKVLEDFEALAPHFKRASHKDRFREVVLWAEILEKGCLRDRFEKLLRMKGAVLPLFLPSNQKVRAKLPEKLHYPGLFERLHEEFYHLIDRCMRPQHILFSLASRLRMRIAEEEIVSPDEIVKKVGRALAYPQFVKAVQDKYQAAIIDEFQDTDQTQWNIFRTLFLGLHTVCLVGDPKQSIYSFRSADLYTYLQAADEVGADNRAVLGVNYRSEPELVRSLNHLFAHRNSPHWLTLPSEDKQLEFSPVGSREENRFPPFNDGKEAVHCFVAKDGGDEAFFPYIANEIGQLLGSVRGEEIAILVKDRFQAGRIHTYLKRCNIPSSLTRSVSLEETAAFGTWIEVVEGMRNPHDESCVKKIAASPLFSWSAEKLRREDLRKEWMELVQIYKSEGFARFFAALCSQCPTLHWDEVFYQEWMQIGDLILEQKKCVLECADAIYFYLLELKEKGVEEEERLKNQVYLSNDHVRIMTIHMSKGLEFEVVFALGLCSSMSKQEEFLRIREKGKYVLSAADEKRENVAYRELEAEKLRALYVAMTRSKRRLYLPFLLDREGKEIPVGLASPMELFFHEEFAEKRVETHLQELADAKVISYEVVGALQPIVMKQEISEMLQKPKPFTFSYPSNPVLSFSSLTKKKEEIFFSREEKEKGEHLPEGKETGIILHAIMEEIFFKERKEVIARKVAGTHLEGWEEEIDQMLERTMNLSIDQFTLNDLDPKKMQMEMEFLYRDEGRSLKGFIDMVCEHQGKYYLFDWKSNVFDDVNEVIQEHQYDVQAKIYTEAFKKYLQLFSDKPFGGAIYIFLRGPVAVWM